MGIINANNGGQQLKAPRMQLNGQNQVIAAEPAEQDARARPDPKHPPTKPDGADTQDLMMQGGPSGLLPAVAPPPFPSKAYSIVDDPLTDHIVRWSGPDSFLVADPGEFSAKVLPMYFKHNNLSSFVRQLNIYGFCKVSSGAWEFANPHFRKGYPERMVDIRRRKSQKDAEQAHSGQQLAITAACKSEPTASMPPYPASPPAQVPPPDLVLLLSLSGLPAEAGAVSPNVDRGSPLAPSKSALISDDPGFYVERTA